jgi:hypothetical protein
MKRSLMLITLLLFGICLVSGQGVEKSMKYYNRTEAGFAFGIASFNTDVYDGIQKSIKNTEIALSLQTINGLMFNNRVALGVGIGAEMWQNGLFFPLFGHLAYYFKPVENTFFGNLSVGYGFGNRDKTSYYEAGTGALMFTAGLGYSREVSKRLRFQFEAFYKYQAIESSYNVYYSDSTMTDKVVDYKVPLSFIGFRVGILFK